MRILIVEDDIILPDGLRGGLNIPGATVDAVTCCAEAHAALSASTFGAVVLDLMLSLKPGWFCHIPFFRGRHKNAELALEKIRAAFVLQNETGGTGLRAIISLPHRAVL